MVQRDQPQSVIPGLAALTVMAFVGIGIANPDFLSFASLSSMGFQFPEFGLMALAVLPTMISGGIDLSIVSIANLASIVAALMLKDGHGWAAMPAAILAGTLCGVLNGVLISYARLPAILATLGTAQVIGGLGVVITRGPAITGLPEWYSSLLNSLVGGFVPFSLIVFAAVAVLLGLVLRFSSVGLQTRLLGANPLAARFSGLSEARILIAVYAASGFISALAGLVVLGHANSAYADYGNSYVLLVVLINILAGVSPSGGFGTVSGVVLAVVLLQLISSGLNFLSFSAFMRDLFFGGLLVVVMAVRVLTGRLHIAGWLVAMRARP